MRLYRTLDAVQRCAPGTPRAVAVGVFDGLHLGHQSILARTRALAAQAGAATLVFSFEPMPREFFAPDNPPARLTRFRERFELLERHENCQKGHIFLE
jgi:riboflavin kinase/FMN adenylyltransferase